MVAQQRAYLRSIRRTVDHSDLCIAGVAGSQGLVVVTNNRAHSDVLGELEVEDWEQDDEGRPPT